MAVITIAQEAGGITPAFIEELTKLSVEADEIGIECGRLRLQRAIQAALELLKEISARRIQQGGR